MATKAQVTGVVVSDKMNKTVKVAIERQIRDQLRYPNPLILLYEL